MASTYHSHFDLFFFIIFVCIRWSEGKSYLGAYGLFYGLKSFCIQKVLSKAASEGKSESAMASLCESALVKFRSRCRFEAILKEICDLGLDVTASLRFASPE